ncbi:MAG: PQQ-binding-like beta-propeller repeat protein [Terracidiphilus sp.]
MKSTGRNLPLLALTLCVMRGVCLGQNTTDWPAYNGGLDGDHYSALTQINRANVNKLKVAWSFDTGEVGVLETNPLIVGQVLYAVTQSEKVFALDGATGKLKWKFDPGFKGTQPVRGLAYWTDGKQGRIFAGVMHFLYCLDADTGQPIASFGEAGRVDLRKDLRGDYRLQSVALTSPGVVYKDLIIVCGRNPESHPSPPGDIRAFDVRTGKLRWTFHTIPHPGEPGYETWPPEAWKTAGAANNWAGMSLDEKRGIVYAPTGSAVFDFYGNDRLGDDLYADTILALDAETGKRLWHFQGVHHDIWDRDFPSPPALVDLKENGKTVEALAQTTKQGYLYVFDRVSGQPLFPIHEHAVLPSPVPGEVAAKTQPKPDLPEPFTRQELTEDQLTTRTPEAHAWAVKEFRTYRSEGQFVPFGLDKPTVIYPGFDGGAEWGGPAVDRATGVIYVNATEMAGTGQLALASEAGTPGERVYRSQCQMCHGWNRKGSPPAFPSLLGVLDRMSAQDVADIVKNGNGRMPAFPDMDDTKLKDLIDFLRTTPVSNGHPNPIAGLEPPLGPGAAPPPADYIFTGYHKFLDPDGYPAIELPWGTLNAIDLKTGKYLWKVPLGEYPELAKQGMKNTGSESYGGPVVTAGGVVFIGATVYDRKFRAFDSRTGKLLWETEMPNSGVATPSTYMIDGRQYVVIAASGGRDPKSTPGGVYIAFALPK